MANTLARLPLDHVVLGAVIPCISIFFHGHSDKHTCYALQKQQIQYLFHSTGSLNVL